MEINHTSDHTSEIHESRADVNERKRQVRLQLLKVMTLMVILLFFLLYLVISNLPSILPVTGLRFQFSIYRLREPSGVTIGKDGTFYVSEPVNKRILAFNANGDLIKRLTPAKGKGRVRGAYGSMIDERRGEVYVADFVWRTVHVFSKTGKPLRQFPKDPFKRAFGERGFVPLDIDMYRDKVYVTTRNGIIVFDRQGRLKEVWGTKRGIGFGQFDFPNGIAINKRTGDIFVADTLNRRVVALDQKGKVKWVVGRPDKGGKLSSFFGLPKGVAVDDMGRVFVVDTFENRLVVISPDGKLLAILGERGVEDGKFNFPEGMAISGSRLAVADKGNSRVQVFSVGTNLPEPSKRRGEERKFKQNLFKTSASKSLGAVRRVRYVNDKPAVGQKL